MFSWMAFSFLPSHRFVEKGSTRFVDRDRFLGRILVSFSHDSDSWKQGGKQASLYGSHHAMQIQ